MTRLELPDLRTGYVDLVDLVRARGDRVQVRGLDTFELTYVTLIFSQPNTPLLPVGVGRQVNTRLAAVEALSLIAGVTRPDLLTRAAPHYGDVLLRPDEIEYGAYGPRVAGQMTQLITLLQDDFTTRRAVLSVWRDDDLFHEGDAPCTATIQFLIRRQLLDMIVTMRSQDVWLGAAQDMFVFGQLRDTVAGVLGIGRGRYVHQVGSLHLYTRDQASATTHLHLPRTTLDVVNLPRGVDVGVDPTWVKVRRDARTLLSDLTDVPYVRTRSKAHEYNPWYAQRMDALYGLIPTGT